MKKTYYPHTITSKVLVYIILPISPYSLDNARNEAVKILFGGSRTEMSDEEQLQCFSNMLLDVYEGKSEHFGQKPWNDSDTISRRNTYRRRPQKLAVYMVS